VLSAPLRSGVDALVKTTSPSSEQYALYQDYAVVGIKAR
jgi:hypothetical protein